MGQMVAFAPEENDDFSSAELFGTDPQNGGYSTTLQLDFVNFEDFEANSNSEEIYPFFDTHDISAPLSPESAPNME